MWPCSWGPIPLSVRRVSCIWKEAVPSSTACSSAVAKSSGSTRATPKARSAGVSISLSVQARIFSCCWPYYRRYAIGIIPIPRVEGLDTLLDLAAAYPIERAAALTGIAPTRITDLANTIRTARRATFHMSVGVNQGPFGTLCYVALQALTYLAGQCDRQGGVLFHPLAVWAAEVARRCGLGTTPVRSRVGQLPSVLSTLPGGILADEILTPGPEQIRALIVVAGDPLTSIPGEARLRQALRQVECLICLDLFQNTTGREADLILPTTSWLERWDIATTTALFQQTSMLQYTRPVRAAPGSCPFRSPYSCRHEPGAGTSIVRESGVDTSMALPHPGRWPGCLVHGAPVASSPVVPGPLGTPYSTATTRALSGTRSTHTRAPDALLAS